MVAADVTGLILAGGMGRRMGGQDKGLLSWQGRPLVVHALERLRPQVSRLLISANRHPETYADFGVPVVGDRMPDYAGPLAGLQAGLLACATPLLSVVPCDVPGFPLDLVARLKAALEKTEAPVAYVATAEREHYTFMLCRREVLPGLEDFLASGDRKIRLWLDRCGAVQACFPDESAFANFNRPEDLE